MHTHRSQGHSSRCLVKAEENSFEYKQHTLLETIVTYIRYHCVLSFTTQNTASKPSQNKGLTPSPSLVLLLSIVLSSYKSGSHKVDTLQTIGTRFPKRASLLSLVWGSSADNPDVDIQWTQCDFQNDDNLCDLRRSFVTFLLHIKVT